MNGAYGGGGGIPGVNSDGSTPGGEIIAGNLTAGDSTAAGVPSIHAINGSVVVRDTAGNNAGGYDLFDVFQQAPVLDTGTSSASYVQRSGDISVHDYGDTMAIHHDQTASARPIYQAKKQNVVQFQIDGDGVAVHGKFKTGASAAHTLGAYSGNSVPIYNEAGTLLGYMPLYA